MRDEQATIVGFILLGCVVGVLAYAFHVVTEEKKPAAAPAPAAAAPAPAAAAAVAPAAAAASTEPAAE